MSRFTELGNDLYTGARSFDFVGRRRRWYVISVIVVILCLAGPFLRGVLTNTPAYNFGIEFTGGSEFIVSGPTSLDQSLATNAVESIDATVIPKVSTLGTDNVRVQTSQMTNAQTVEVKNALAKAYAVPATNVTSSFIGATWGQDLSLIHI
jgi:preprotein translocase subunit SecF